MAGDLTSIRQIAPVIRRSGSGNPRPLDRRAGQTDAVDSADWLRVEAAVVAETGTLPDGTVDGVRILDWQAFLNLVKERGWRAEFKANGDPRPVPKIAEDLFLGPDARATLSLWITPTIQINVFIYDSKQICFDFATREIAGGGLRVVGEFCRDLGRTTGKPVRLAHEGHGASNFLLYDPTSDTFEPLI